MSDLIFSNVIKDFINSSDNINNFFNNVENYNTNISSLINITPKYNLIIYIFISMICFNFYQRFEITAKEIFILIIVCIIIYTLIHYNFYNFKNFLDDKKIELDYIHKIIFNNKKFIVASKNYKFQKINTPISYLHINPLLIQFYFDIKDFMDYNESAYINSILAANDLLGFDFQSRLGLNNNFLNYQVAIDKLKISLNELNTLIYSIDSDQILINKFQDSISILHKILNQHLLNISNLSKKNNKNLHIYNYPNNFYDEYFHISPNDLKTNNYQSTFNLF